MSNQRILTLFCFAVLCIVLAACRSVYAPEAEPVTESMQTSTFTGQTKTEMVSDTSTEPVELTETPSADESRHKDYSYTKTSLGISVKPAHEKFGVVVIPEEIDSLPVVGIASGAFRDQTQITEVILPESVTTIAASAFRGCSSLVRIEAKGTLASIGASAFSDCKALNEAILPGTYKELRTSTFKNCASLTTFYLPEGVQTVRENAFANCRSLVRIGIPATIKTLEKNAFSECPSLTEYDLTDLAAYCLCAGERAQSENPVRIFVKGEEITDLFLDDSVKSVMPLAFYKCRNIKSVVFPQKSVKIGHWSFYDCGIESLTITKNMNISSGAFEGCRSLRSVKLEEGVKNLGYIGIGSDCASLQKIELPASLEKVETLGALSSLEEIVLPEENLFFGCDGKALWQKSDGRLMCAATGYIPQNGEVKIIPQNYCFQAELGGTLTIPEGIEIIEGSAFCKCGITKVVLPSSLKTVAAFSFSDNPIKTLTVPEGVESFDMSAVKNTGLSWIVLPVSVGDLGLIENINNVPTIYYAGNEASFRKIEKTTKKISGGELVVIPVDGQAIPLPKGLYLYSEEKPDIAGNYWHYVNGTPEKWN